MLRFTLPTAARVRYLLFSFSGSSAILCVAPRRTDMQRARECVMPATQPAGRRGQMKNHRGVMGGADLPDA
eukprot:COSAG01_NODE_32126_length_586_cov_0.673511_1_plen_70_part_10